MSTDVIAKIQIDDLGRLRVYPANKTFDMIWRSAAEVHWDKEGFLYSPKPREWSYFNWYQQIVSVVKDEYGCVLSINKNTLFVAISQPLQQEILQFTI